MCKQRTDTISTNNSPNELKYHRQIRAKPIGVLPLKILFSFFLLSTLSCSSHVRAASRLSGSIKELQTLINSTPPPFSGHCNFEETCDWSWNNTNGFRKVAATETAPSGPDTDASEQANGHFLWLNGQGKGHIWSKLIPSTGSQCLLELALYQVQMLNGIIGLLIETTNRTSVLSSERSGNNHARWENTSFNLGPISQQYQVVLEITTPFPNSSIAVDDIRLSNCFPESVWHGATCTKDMFRCKHGSCVNKTRICDLTADCAYGEDEQLECDKIPSSARCNFEYGWCGWSNDPSMPLYWMLHNGPTPAERTGPSYDHTYRNSTGIYVYVNMAVSSQLGDRAGLDSPIYNPTPPYSSDETSPFFKSCQVRFFYHQYGVHSGGLALYLVQIKQHQNVSEKIFWTFGDRGDVWNNQAVVLPRVKYRYFLRFEANRGRGSKSEVAIDDITLSRECFGIGVPPEYAGNFDYWNYVPSEKEPGKHTDFANETTIKVTTCGATGRYGPTPQQCAAEHNGTDLDLLYPSTMSSTTIVPGEKITISYMRGIQRWTVPRSGFYTIIGMGASGGRGSGQTGTTLGAAVRAVIELNKGQQLYFIVGQAGMNACPKNLGGKAHSCQNESLASIALGSGYTSAVHQVKKIVVKDSGGGGGGATYIFAVMPNGEQKPLIIAAGGGGLGQFADDGFQHGHGAAPKGRMPESGVSISGSAGSGGGWNKSTNNGTNPTTAGTALILGGLGGAACHNNSGRGDGGFGGGGGGCRGGGGGGGYIGGNTGNEESSNGQGGYSFAAPELLHVSYTTGINSGPGKVFIIPAISGCHCDFRCVTIDEHLSKTKCLCPAGWVLGNDTRSCVMDADIETHRTFMILLIAVSIGLLFAFSGLCLLLYNRYQHRKALLRRRQVMFGNGTELTSLRAVSDSMMTEFNPNYEFAGNLYSFKDLPQIPRDNISLVKPLGQGAFGEVFQGVYKYNRTEEHPVAVKTLPSLSTSQAEADFMMEALIMSKFNHPNIVHFIGVSFDNHPRYIVLELLAGGDLKNFLREERPRPDRPTTLTMQDLVMCAYDVANGCKYMEDARFIHRDIAARNCLLTSKGSGRIVKIADFGMARDIYRSDYYRKGGKAMLPIKWMPPESFLDGIFTTKTDVWAFGVLLWEIMSFGYMPYTGCANREVMSMVTTGGRLERPAGCPDPIYGVMTQCWHPHPEDRPSFSTIVERIGYCLQDPDVIDHEMPNYDILPACEREITIMRPDPETECINVRSSLDGCGYMQPKANFRPVSYRIGPAPGIVYASLQHCVDCENESVRIQETALSEPDTHRQNCAQDYNNESSIHIYGTKETCRHKALAKELESNANVVTVTGTAENNSLKCQSKMPNGKPHKENGNCESTTTTDTNSDSLAIPTSNPPPETSLSSPNTRMSSPHHMILNSNVNNNNGILRKSALKAALSLDPGALCRGTIPYEKIAFSPPPPRLSNPGSIELRKDSLGQELPREEECSC